MVASAAMDPRVRAFVEEAYWYHTLDLAEGLRTRGVFDHRPHLRAYGFPDDLTGRTAIDVGTSDGFFAFELERRGGKEVVAIDTDAYDGRPGHSDISPTRVSAYEEKYSAHFAASGTWMDVAAMFGLDVPNRRLIARNLLGSSVEFRTQSVYDLAAAGEQYDIVFCGDLVEHLKHPLAALENLRAATRELCILALSSALHGGRAAPRFRRALRRVISGVGLDGYVIESSEVARYVGHYAGGAFFWFHPHALRAALLASGFSRVRIAAEFDLPHLPTGARNRHTIFHCTP